MIVPLKNKHRKTSLLNSLYAADGTWMYSIRPSMLVIYVQDRYPLPLKYFEALMKLTNRAYKSPYFIQTQGFYGSSKPGISGWIEGRRVIL